MQITKIEKMQVEDVSITIELFLGKNNNYSVVYKYTCPKCAGHGCHIDKNCNSGTIIENLDLADVDKIFPIDTAYDIKKIIGEIKTKVSPITTQTIR